MLRLILHCNVHLTMVDSPFGPSDELGCIRDAAQVGSKGGEAENGSKMRRRNKVHNTMGGQHDGESPWPKSLALTFY